jgi:hypothetical protein
MIRFPVYISGFDVEATDAFMVRTISLQARYGLFGTTASDVAARGRSSFRNRVYW